MQPIHSRKMNTTNRFNNNNADPVSGWRQNVINLYYVEPDLEIKVFPGTGPK